MHYAGLDLHKRIIQIAVVDKHGDKLLNKNISSSLDVLKKELARMPKDTQYVIESSSVWKGVYNCMVHDLELDVMLSNPYKTRLIAENPDAAQTAIRIARLIGGTNDNGSF